jgi:DNA-binding transcriptional LysR family regulator
MLRNLSNADLSLLRVFRVVAKYEGFSAAQAELNVGPSTISLQMSDLESRLGAKLCNRGRSGFMLTEEGKLVLEASDKLFDDLQQFQSKVDTITGDLMGELHIAVVEGNNTHFEFRLHETIRRFQRRNSTACIHIRTAAPNVSERLILDDEADIGVGLFTRKMPQLEYESLFSSRVGLFCGQQNPFFDRDDSSINTDEIYTFPHVRRGYFSNDQMPKPHKAFNNCAVASSVEAMAYFLLSGEFLGFMPIHYAQRWIDSGELRPLKTDQFEYTWNFYLAWRKGRGLKATARAFLDDIRTERSEVEQKAC